MTTPTVSQQIHPGWFELVKCIGRHALTRRKFLSAAAGGAGVVFWRGLPLATSRAQTGGMRAFWTFPIRPTGRRATRSSTS